MDRSPPSSAPYRLAFAVIVATFATRVGLARAEPPVAPTTAWDGTRVELQWLGQPDQPRDHTCTRRADCYSATRSFNAAAISGRFVEEDSYALGLTLGLGHAYDWERRPATGFGVLSLRADIQVEIGRTGDDFGVAVRISPGLLYGWAGEGGSFQPDFPGLGAIFGWRDLWLELGLPAQPTHADPRLFFLQAAWRNDHIMAAAAVCTFATHAFAGDDIEKAGAFFGVWLEGRARLWQGFEAHVTLALSQPTVLGLGVAWAFDSEPSALFD
jgi:hypothetical protein